jgi:hypothetical protein
MRSKYLAAPALAVGVLVAILNWASGGSRPASAAAALGVAPGALADWALDGDAEGGDAEDGGAEDGDAQDGGAEGGGAEAGDAERRDAEGDAPELEGWLVGETQPRGRPGAGVPTCGRAYGDAAAFRAALHRGRARTICLLGSAARPAAANAVRFAHAAIGAPYVWAGDGPADGGYDCSGLTSASYASAGVRLPRTAQSQYNAGPRLSSGRPILPGDLVFFGRGPHRVTHVGIAVSATQMINAPQPGERVKIGPIQRRDFVGATRPAPLALP